VEESHLQSDAQLRHGSVADVLTLLVNPAAAVRGTDTEAPLADRREDRIAVVVVEERRARTAGSYHNGMAVFTIMKGGATAEASVADQKFSYQAR
jgi:hypothetical protein